MRKMILVTLFLFSLFLTACLEDIQPEVVETGIRETIQTENQTEIIYQPSPLIFNTLEIDGAYNISWEGNDFFLPITDEQLSEIFPFIELADAERIRAYAEYQSDGTLVKIDFRMDLPAGSIYRFEIMVGFGEPPMSSREYGFFDNEIFEHSSMHDVSVIALMIDDPLLYDLLHFDATFVIDDIYHRVRFNDEEERGKNRMNEIVNKFILNGIERFSVLENPEIPYMRDEFITFENAQLDPDFGAFVPNFVPEELTFHWGNRRIQEHLDENSLTLIWEVYYDEPYLYEIYTDWVNQRTADTPVFPFEEIHWGMNEFYWLISPIREGDLEFILSVSDFMQDDALLDASEPIFISDELTFELIKRLERTANPYSFPEGAYWEENLDIADILIPYARNWFRFGILFDDTLVTIHVWRNATPEMIWSMLEGLLD